MSVCVLEERQLDLDEKPLVVQLNWNKDDREGRFVLKNENDILPKVWLLCLCNMIGEVHRDIMSSSSLSSTRRVRVTDRRRRRTA